jgi:putative endonuclease
MYYVYILVSYKDNNCYVGYTKDLKQRVCQHNKGKVKSTRNRKPLKLIYYEAYLEEKDARRRELHIKNSGQQREILKERLKYSI